MKIPQNIFNTVPADLEEEGSWLTVHINVFFKWRCFGRAERPPLLAEEPCSGRWVPAPAVPLAVTWLDYCHPLLF